MNKWLLILLFIPLLFSSCRDDDSQGSSSGGQVTAHFSLSVAGLKSTGGSTRSIDPTTVSESTVNNLWVLQFQNGTLATRNYFPSVDVTAFDTKLSSGSSNIYFVANAGPSAFSSFTNATTEATFQSATKSLSAETDVLTNSTYIPMEGSLTSVTVPSTGYMASQTITLTRMLARVTLNYTTSLSNFEVRKIRICNVPNTMQYYPPTSSTAAFPASPSASTMNTYDYTDVSGTTGSCTFYLPENQRGKGSNTALTDLTLKSGLSYATYIELVGYTKGATTAGQEVVYKIYPGADSYNDYNICRNTSYTVAADISGASGADPRVTRTPRANCYIVAPGKSVYIPLARANDSDLGTQISNLTTTPGYTFGVLWQDQSSSTSAVLCSQSAADQTFGVFKVTASSTYSGNAVVYVKNSSGAILWSWHIWVTSYDPNVTNSTIGSYTFMDRNLGTTNNAAGSAYKGLYYQWGRKDPFPQASAVSSNTMETVYNGSGTTISLPSSVITGAPTTNNYLQSSVQSPTNWYYTGTTTYDWYAATTANQNNGLWGTIKTVYDPCPAGWKVMPVAAYSNFSASTMAYSSSNYGWTHTASGTFWPLSGLLNSNTGTFSSVGSNGSYWSSAPYSTNASDLYLYAGSVLPSDNCNRAYGFGVRCVQDK